MENLQLFLGKRQVIKVNTQGDIHAGDEDFGILTKSKNIVSTVNVYIDGK